MTLDKMIRSAFVIARRDFTATVISKTFLLFLLGPLFPLIVGVGFGGLGAQMERNAPPATVAVISSLDDFALMAEARERLTGLGGDQPLVALSRVDPEPDAAAQRQRLLASEQKPVLGVLEGGLFAPHFTGAVHADGTTVRQIRQFVWQAQQRRAMPMDTGQEVTLTLTETSAGSVASSREVTARIGQTILFVLTILLAGHAAVATDRGEIVQGDRGSRRRDPGRIDLHRQIVRDAGDGVGRDIGVDQRRRGGDRPGLPRRPRRAARAGGRLAVVHRAGGALFLDELPAHRLAVPRHRQPGLDRARGADAVDARDDGARL